MRRGRGRLFFYLDEIGAFVAQQGVEGAAAEAGLVQLVAALGGDGEDLEAALALPGAFDLLAQRRLAPALRHAHGDVETLGRERAQFPAVGGLHVGVRDDEDATHSGW